MVAHAFPRWEGDPAGAFVWRLAQALAERGHEITAVAPADRGDAGGARLGDVAVRRVRYSWAGRETLAYRGTMHADAGRSPLAALAFAGLVMAFRREVEAACAGGRADLVHAHWWIPGGVSTRLARRSGRPYVVTLHGTDVALARKVPGARAAFGAVLRGAARVTAVSSALADEAARSSGRPVSGITVSPMPLVLAPQGAAAASAGAVGGTASPRGGVVFVGRLTAQKRVGVLLDALAMLAARGRPLRLTVVGDGPERGSLEARAARSDVAGLVTFVGQVAPERVPAHLRAARLLVLPSVDEGLGLVVAEALVAGTPVVGARSGGIPDLLTDPDSGVLVPPDDGAALADAIALVAGEERFLSGAAREGRALAERLSPAAVAERFEAVYEAALRGRSQLAAGAER